MLRAEAVSQRIMGARMSGGMLAVITTMGSGENGGEKPQMFDWTLFWGSSLYFIVSLLAFRRSLNGVLFYSVITP